MQCPSKQKSVKRVESQSVRTSRDYLLVRKRDIINHSIRHRDYVPRKGVMGNNMINPSPKNLPIKESRRCMCVIG